LPLRPRRLEVRDRRPVHYLAIRIEAGAMTGTVPRLFSVVPIDDTVKMCADCGTFVDFAERILVNRDLVHAATYDRTRVVGNLVSATSVARCYPARILFRHIQVFASEMRRRAQCYATRIVNIRPWIRDTH